MTRYGLLLGMSNAKLTKSECPKCGGSGRIERWRSIANGVCFSCKGKGYHLADLEQEALEEQFAEQICDVCEGLESILWRAKDGDDIPEWELDETVSELFQAGSSVARRALDIFVNCHESRRALAWDIRRELCRRGRVVKAA